MEDFLSPVEEQQLLASVSWSPEEVGGALRQRAVRHFGYEFIYGANNVDPSRPLPAGLPPACLPLLDRLIDAGHLAELPDQLTVNRYEPGQGIPPHVDTHSAFREIILSVSCGAQVVMDFREPQQQRKTSLLLPPRSVLVFTGAARYQWTHGIAARKADLLMDENGAPALTARGTRTSFTFRKVSDPPVCDCQFPDQCDYAK